jgi:D-alanyl-D-alanine carboxypeptidase
LELEEIIKVNTLAGYSEHHSGCAIDIGSKDQPVLETEFENTPAFHWLKINAGDFNFTLSYPKNNLSGMIYEPWHWCYRTKEYNKLDTID